MGKKVLELNLEDYNKPYYKLICRLGFGYVLSAQHIEPTFGPHGDTFICKHPSWNVMQERIKLAEALFHCKCEYENISFLTGQPEKGAEAKQDFFDHEFFRKAPAMARLRGITDPTITHLRACVMELTRYILSQAEKE